MTDAAFNSERLDEVVLALLWANSFSEYGYHRAWKSLPWDALDRLHKRNLISNPRSRTRSVALVGDAHEHGRKLFEQWFGANSPVAESTPVAKRPSKAKAGALTKVDSGVHQFKVTLGGINPPIWRRIQLPSNATFWDLHCAINDAMGWEDAHLHAFRIGGRRDEVEIGVPMEDNAPSGLVETKAGWEVPIAKHFDKKGARCTYIYDFGDDWVHSVVLEAILPFDAKARYPRCTAGARACPPEDCGGIPGYLALCAALANPAGADEHGQDLLEWIGEDYDPEQFDPAKVKFHSAARRLKALRSQI